MNVDLDGRMVLIHGAAGRLRTAIEAALHANGAEIANAGDDSPGEPYALIFISHDANGLFPSAADTTERYELSRLVEARLASLQRVVAVLSSAALVPVKGFADFSAEQAGLERMVRVLAMELGPNVRVNGVAVGAIEGEDNSTERLIGHTAVRRAGTHDEVCAAVLFLLDPDNTYMTGHTLAVDGGWAIGYARNF